jgi:hypothetical protein
MSAYESRTEGNKRLKQFTDLAGASPPDDDISKWTKDRRADLIAWSEDCEAQAQTARLAQLQSLRDTKIRVAEAKRQHEVAGETAAAAAAAAMASPGDEALAAARSAAESAAASARDSVTAISVEAAALTKAAAEAADTVRRMGKWIEAAKLAWSNKRKSDGGGPRARMDEDDDQEIEIEDDEKTDREAALPGKRRTLAERLKDRVSSRDGAGSASWTLVVTVARDVAEMILATDATMPGTPEGAKHLGVVLSAKDIQTMFVAVFDTVTATATEQRDFDLAVEARPTPKAGEDVASAVLHAAFNMGGVMPDVHLGDTLEERVQAQVSMQAAANVLASGKSKPAASGKQMHGAVMQVMDRFAALGEQMHGELADGLVDDMGTSDGAKARAVMAEMKLIMRFGGVMISAQRALRSQLGQHIVVLHGIAYPTRNDAAAAAWPEWVKTMHKPGAPLQKAHKAFLETLSNYAEEERSTTGMVANVKKLVRDIYSSLKDATQQTSVLQAARAALSGQGAGGSGLRGGGGGGAAAAAPEAQWAGGGGGISGGGGGFALGEGGALPLSPVAGVFGSGRLQPAASVASVHPGHDQAQHGNEQHGAAREERGRRDRGALGGPIVVDPTLDDGDGQSKAAKEYVRRVRAGEQLPPYECGGRANGHRAELSEQRRAPASCEGRIADPKAFWGVNWDTWRPLRMNGCFTCNMHGVEPGSSVFDKIKTCKRVSRHPSLF